MSRWSRGEAVPRPYAPRPEVLVLGVGNILLRDEGLGVRAVERLAAAHLLPEQVCVLDGGTMGLDLLPYLQENETLLMVDAVQAGRPPGTLVRLEGDEILPALALKLSAHQVGLQELLATGRLLGTLPSCIVLWGIEPASLDWGLDLSPPVAARLDELVEAVYREVLAMTRYKIMAAG
jgi:hydrogenase maturation protease